MDRGPALHRVRANGVTLACFEWRGDADDGAPPVLLAHATGYHARVFDRLVAQLGPRRVLAVDLRGHGRSEKTPIEHWRVFGEDLAALVDALDLRGLVGVGHSMGGHAIVDATARAGDRFARLVLIDPVIASPDEYREAAATPAHAAALLHPTIRRRNRFASVAEMIERFRERLPYSQFDRDVLRDYCTYGLLPCTGGDGFELACPPEVEASIYRSARTNGGVLESVRAIAIPVTVVRAKRPPAERDPMDFSSSPTWPELASAFRDGLDVHFAERSHFLPLESPELAARFVLSRDPRED